MASKGLKAFEISIHALREEGDTTTGKMLATLLQFQSTPSARRATWVRCCPH